MRAYEASNLHLEASNHTKTMVLEPWRLLDLQKQWFGSSRGSWTYKSNGFLQRQILEFVFVFVFHKFVFVFHEFVFVFHEFVFVFHECVFVFHKFVFVFHLVPLKVVKSQGTI